MGKRRLAFAVIAVALAARLLVLVRVPGVFGPGDPAIHQALAAGCLREGAPHLYLSGGTRCRAIR